MRSQSQTQSQTHSPHALSLSFLLTSSSFVLPPVLFFIRPPSFCPPPSFWSHPVLVKCYPPFIALIFFAANKNQSSEDFCFSLFFSPVFPPFLFLHVGSQRDGGTAGDGVNGCLRWPIKPQRASGLTLPPPTHTRFTGQLMRLQVL